MATFQDMMEALGQLEVELLNERAALIELDNAYRGAGLGPIPQRYINNFEAARKQAAQTLTKTLSDLQSAITNIPGIPDSVQQLIFDRLGGQDWGLAFLDKVPPLKRQSSGALGILPAVSGTLAWGILLSIGAISAAVIAWQIKEIRVATAAQGVEEAKSRASVATALAQKAESLRQAGATPKEIIDATREDAERLAQPPPSNDPFGLGGIGDILKYGLFIYLGIQFVPVLVDGIKSSQRRRND